MDAGNFDAFVSAIARGASRRRLLAMVSSGFLLTLAELSTESALTKNRKKRKKKKKKKKPLAPDQCPASETPCGDACCTAVQTCIAGQCLGTCQFSDDNDLKIRTMEADCIVTETIVIPNEFTLEGGGKTIHLTGPVSGYQAETPDQINVRAGLLIKNGTGSIRNLTIDQDAWECEGGLTTSAIVFASALGTVEAVDIVLTNDNQPCYRGGINAQIPADNNAVNIRNVSITGNRFSAIAISKPAETTDRVRGEIRDCTIDGPSFGMVLSGTANGFPIAGNTVTANVGITLGSFPTNVLIDDNTITGVSGATNLFGVNFSDDAAGTVSDNTITGFTCGIAIQDGAGLVAESGNTFSANATNVCDPP